METISLLGYKVSRSGLTADVLTALGWLGSRDTARYVACANPHSLVVASRDSHFRTALQSADLLLPDGIGIVHSTKLLGVPPMTRVAGYDFFLRFTAEAARLKGVRYYFLGATPAALRLIRQRLAREFPSIIVCGSYAPPFTDTFSAEENEKIVAAINRAEPDVLWVGMTAPKQEKWIIDHRGSLQVSCIGAIGAVFDFYSGIARRSPVFWQRLGLEWLHRLCREPTRLWQRSFISAPLFVLMVVREFVRSRLHPEGIGHKRKPLRISKTRL